VFCAVCGTPMQPGTVLCPQGHPQPVLPREHPEGQTVLILGILGLVLCGVLAPIAWIKGKRVLADMDAQPGVVWSNRGNVQTGQLLGLIGTILIGVVAAFFAVVLVLQLLVLLGALASFGSST